MQANDILKERFQLLNLQITSVGYQKLFIDISLLVNTLYTNYHLVVDNPRIFRPQSKILQDDD